jgi:hypothetical protein
MNVLGADEVERRVDEIATFLRDNADKWSWTDHLKAAALAVKTGLAFKLNPVDPYGGLVKEAIRRYREKKAKESEAGAAA